MRVRFIGGPASGNIYDLAEPLPFSFTVAHYDGFKMAQSSHNLNKTLEYKVAIYDLDHAIIDGEEWNVYIYRAPGI